MAGQRGTVVFLQPLIGYMDEVRSKPGLPLSLLHAASELNREFDVRIVDQRVEPDWPGRLAAEVRARPLYVGVTASTGPTIGHALAAARLVRRADPRVPIVWGGPHPTLVAEQTLAHHLVDAVVVGDGERPALEIARRLQAGQRLDGIPGVGIRVDGAPTVTPPAKPRPLDALPPPPLALIDVARYVPMYQGRRSISMESSRGCPHACRYCYNCSAHSEGWRAHSPEHVLDLVRVLVEDHGVEDIYFVDDNFFIDRSRAAVIAEGLSAIGCSWQVQGADLKSLERFDDETLATLRASGCQRLTLGIESGSDRLREVLGKKGTAADVERLVARLAPFGFVVFGSFMTNLPGETRDDLVASVQLIERLHRANPHFRNSPIYSYTPFPGTPMFEDAVQDGYRPPDTLDGWANLSYEGSSYRPRGAPGPAYQEGLYLSSLLNDAKFEDYGASPLMRVLARAYRPVARYRLRHLMFDLMPERFAARLWY